MNGKVVRLLDEPASRSKLPQHKIRANKKYKKSAKGRAAQRRSYLQRRRTPELVALDNARACRWRKNNPVTSRVYIRTWMRTYRRMIRNGERIPHPPTPGSIAHLIVQTLRADGPANSKQLAAAIGRGKKSIQPRMRDLVRGGLVREGEVVGGSIQWVAA